MESTTLFTPVVHLELCNFVHLFNITPNFVEDVTDSLCLGTMCGMLDSIDRYLHCICILCCSFFAVVVTKCSLFVVYLHGVGSLLFWCLWSVVITLKKSCQQEENHAKYVCL